MRTFTRPRTVTAERQAQVTDRVTERGNLQKFNLSRGHVYPGNLSCARGGSHTPIVELNYLKNIYSYNLFKGLAATEPP